MKYVRIYTDFGFGGTDETKIVKVPDDYDLELLYQITADNMYSQLSCSVETVEKEDLEEYEIEYAEDWT